MSLQNESRLDWLKRARNWECLKCKPREVRYSLVRTVSWCPICKRVWWYRYMNIEQVVKKAIRFWWYEDNPKERFRI